MSISDITNKIIQDATKEADSILKEAENDVVKIEKELNERKKELKNEHEKEMESLARDNEKRVKSVAKREVKINIERVKREEVNKAYDLALQNMISFSENEYKDFLKKILSKIPSETKGVFYCPKNREKETKDVMIDLGFKNKLSLSDDFAGGIIVLGDDFEYNFTFEQILKEKRGLIEAEVAKILFEK